MAPKLSTNPLGHLMSDRPAERSPAAALAALAVFACLAIPVGLIAIALGCSLLRLPAELLVVRERLPVAFPLHMVAAGLSLIFIPIAATVRPWRRVHRAAGRLAAACVVAAGLTALPVAAASEATLPARLSFAVQGLVWLGLLVGAILAIRRRDVARHARLMMAMAAVASGAIWLRLMLWAAVSAQLPFEASYAVSAWASWLLPLGCVLALRPQPATGEPVPRSA